MQELKKILLDEFEYFSLKANPRQIEMWSSELSDLTPIEIRRALKVLHRSSKLTRPATPAQIRDVVYGFPATDEAWALCPHNEDQTVVWCEEVAVAYGQVRHLVNSGEMIAARMAFKEIYDREVMKSKANGKKPIYRPSLGHDPAGRDAAIKEAVERNLMSAQDAIHFCPDLALPAAQVLQIEGAKETFTESVREENLAKFRELMNELKKKKNKASETVANQPDAKPNEQHKPTTAHSNESIEVGAQAVNKI